MASVIVVTAGAALTVSVPFMALKESLESRFKRNMKKHLGHKQQCRVYFPGMEDELDHQYKRVVMKNKNKDINDDKKMVSNIKCSSDDEDNSSTISSPPSYNEITQPPAYDLLMPHGN